MRAVCIASGPSLTRDDCERVRAWRAFEADRMVICTNTSFRFVPWADAVFAMDHTWWNVYGDEVLKTFQGKRFTVRGNTAKSLATPIGSELGWRNFGNSGAGSIVLAMMRGAKHITLLGYDCRKANGEVHCHGSHEGNLGNAASLSDWPKQFGNLAAALKDEHIVNATRNTALTCFPCSTLEAALSP